MPPPSEKLRALSNARVVLVRPSHPGNIGAAARAMHTMGLSRLVLVAPERFPDPQADAMASHGTEVLLDAEVVDTLDEALAGTVLQVAFSARPRTLSHVPLDPREAAIEVLDVAADVATALVFGNETYGLSNEEVLRCSHLATIPAVEGASSLNLAAAVQVAVYELRMAALGSEQPSASNVAALDGQGELARHEDVERFLTHLEESLYTSGFLQRDNPRRLMERMRRLFARSRLQVEEVNILRGMLTLWDESGKRN